MFVVVITKETVLQEKKYLLIFGTDLIAIMVVPLTHLANSKQVGILLVHLLGDHRVKALHHNVEV